MDKNFGDIECESIEHSIFRLLQYIYLCADSKKNISGSIDLYVIIQDLENLGLIENKDLNNIKKETTK